MAARRPELRYCKLEIVGSSLATEIWLGDDAGHLVQKEVGELKTSVLAGSYVVEFGPGVRRCYPVHLEKACRFTQAELEAGPTCPRPAVRLLAEPADDGVT